ncbi:hypothetical protein BY996DRAFT_6415554 [Phakopsora pachyrhizi]|nr:hypothetical protein BY996DRAFT_6425042 [Phakopsora pachyrhizi]KAI8452395.1 hypothetical protein BY996DRAFT_6415554 [Phakopsora pachyrhizi]
MVGDKWQVRTTGKVDQLTRQPVKGRRRGGGIRFGEMERDALLAHGTLFLLQDRLMNCLDYSTAWICKRCGLFNFIGEEVTISVANIKYFCGVVKTDSDAYLFSGMSAEAPMDFGIKLGWRQSPSHLATLKSKEWFEWDEEQNKLSPGQTLIFRKSASYRYQERNMVGNFLLAAKRNVANKVGLGLGTFSGLKNDSVTADVGKECWASNNQEAHDLIGGAVSAVIIKSASFENEDGDVIAEIRRDTNTSQGYHDDEDYNEDEDEEDEDNKNEEDRDEEDGDF